MARRNPIEALEPAENLFEQLNKVGGRLFTLEEIRNFVDYCMRALQSCPESAREWISAGWSKDRHMANDTLYVQSVLLSEGAVNVEVKTRDFIPNRVLEANVDLESMHATEFSQQFPPIPLKDEYVGSQPAQIDQREKMVGFVMAIYDDLFAKKYGPSAPRTDPDIENEVHSTIISFLKPKNIFDWCHEQDPRKFEWKPSAIVYHTGARWVTVHFPMIVRYARLIERLRTIADELEEAGWQPEPDSYQERGKLCRWDFVNAEHPGG